jgi:hypothetical protein
MNKRIKDDGSIEELHKIVVHTFSVGDVEDPDLYASQPLWEWQESEKGKWVMENAIEKPIWHRQMDHMIYGYRYAITATLPKDKYIFYKLKFE